MPERLVVATSGAALDRARAAWLIRELAAAWPERELAIALLALEPGSSAAREALRAGRADLALHALAELDLAPAPGIARVAVPQRGDPREALVSRGGRVLAYLPEGSRVGVDCQRRGGQLLRRRSDLVLVPSAGDPASRLARLDADGCEALVLGAAELERLDLGARIAERFDPDQMIPAPGQAALALEARADDARMRELLAPLHDPLSAYAVEAERACLARLGAGPGAPVGVHAITDGEQMVVRGAVVSADGTRTARMHWSGPARDAVDLGETLAELLISIGADKILSGAPMPRTLRYSLHPGGRDVEPGGEAEPPAAAPPA